MKTNSISLKIFELLHLFCYAHVMKIKDKFMKEFANDILTYRKRLGISQSELAEKFGYKKKNSICMIEGFHTPIDAKLLIERKDLFNWSDADILKYIHKRILLRKVGKDANSNKGTRKKVCS